MPLVMIHAVPPEGPSAVSEMLANVRDSGAKALGSLPSDIWVMFLPLSSAHTTLPVVIVKAKAGRSAAQKNAFAKALAAEVGKGLATPEGQVWLHYEEMNPKDVWFEGRWSVV